MKNLFLLIGLFVVLLISGCTSKNSTAIVLDLKKALETYDDVTTKEEAIKRGGYWYKGKCWVNFDKSELGIEEDKIDSFVTEQLELIKDAYLLLDNRDFKIDSITFEIDEMVTLLISFKRDGADRTLIIFMNMENIESGKDFESQIIIFEAGLDDLEEREPIALGIVPAKSYGSNTMDFNFIGTLDSTDGKKIKLDMLINGALVDGGSTSIRIEGSNAFLNGTLGTVAYAQIKDLIENHKDVDTIVLENVPGSINNAVDMYTGKLIRKSGLTTKVLDYSEIASGGVDIFCAGKERIVTKGAKIGVHSWATTGYTGGELPRDHPAHQYQLEYFRICLGDIGEGFYFYTLNAAEASGIHWMSLDEIKQWTVATRIQDSNL